MNDSKIIFLDLDDTLADTSLDISKRFIINQYVINDKANTLRNFTKVFKAWSFIKSNPHFWEELPLTDHALDLYKKCEQITDNIHVLTALPSLFFKKDHFFSEAGKFKKKWLQNKFPSIDQSKISVGYAKEKHLHISLHSGVCILLDDSKSNINRWKNAGGIGILIQSQDMQAVFEQLDYIKNYSKDNKLLVKDFYLKFK